ncbi:DUF1259 domain-containing protein [Paenibacillus crassostreae]|uniref:DUF1259 domain-containing protein n=1 Tax=Paenibacillus crassostreae TaxID=1763538 RepID=A0A167DR25_9BACL|nr:DUF1259 domain-containing protein [Paenibacillus crassostreae]AOZ91159.1 hypothetical protein LPB68_02340 [Paenibacillus crassostreae]OAB74681.1 hypothetical protein PNBC_11620 [Paenibacillus crassostreae]
MSVSPQCRQFAEIFGGEAQVINGVCVATKLRTNIRVNILNRRSKGLFTIPFGISYESVSADGRALCLGETVILTSEINPFISRLRRAGIKVTSLHNHWLFTNPNIWYIHWEAIQRPLVFARNVRNASSVLTTQPVGPIACRTTRKK